MVTYLDTQTGGLNNDLTQGGTFQWNLNLGTKFWLNIANNVITGQASGQAVTFKVWDIRGSSEVTVPYGKHVSRPVTGHLVTTVPATLPATPNADVHIILDDDPVPLEVQFVGTATSSGGSTFSNSANFVPGIPPTIVYTVPPGYNAELLTATVAAGGSDSVNLAVYSVGNPAADLIFKSKTGTTKIGQGAGMDVIVNPPKEMAPGDQVVVQDFSGSVGGTISYTIRLVPQ